MTAEPDGGAAAGGVLVARDPRALVLAALVLIVFVASFPKYGVVPLAPLAVLVALGVAAAPVRAGMLLRRLAVAAPFAALLGLANPWLDVRPLTLVGGFAVRAGWISFATIVLKVLLSVTAVIVLVALVPLPRLSSALRALRVPRALVSQVHFVARYLGVLLAEAASMRRARDLRSGGSRRALRLRVASSMLAVLLHRSLERGERIHLAMEARGFDGEIRLLGTLRWRAADTVLVVFVAVACAAVRFLPVTGWIEGVTLG
jgi:cobalt/nickel transport system permease protein